MKPIFFIGILLLLASCQSSPADWQGPVLTYPRDELTVETLLNGEARPLLDMSYFAQPSWADTATTPFSGTISIQESELRFPKEKEHYPGETTFPKLKLDFMSYKGKLIPSSKSRINTRMQGNSYWDVLVGTGRVWQEDSDGDWSRASFPLTLTDRWMGQARNCVATFVYKSNAISPICLQCSQETADIDDRQLGNISGMLTATFKTEQFDTTLLRIQLEEKAERLPVQPLAKIDARHKVADYFEKKKITHAPTSTGAVLLNDTLYRHQPQTRHGPYPYPDEMRHGVYSVTKSMAGALALLYFAERYEDDVFAALITDYVPALADHEGWQGVTFGQTLNMVTGTEGGEDAARLFSTLIIAETAEEAIQHIAQLGDAPPQAGEQFNYASTNLFVLSYALQNFVQAKEGSAVHYWQLLRESVLQPIGAPHFTVLHTQEENGHPGIPRLAYGALPTLDEAAKIALLFANDGRHKGQQLLKEEKVKEIFGKTDWPGYPTHNDFRGDNYRHSFWSKPITKGKCTLRATYMLGFGENYVLFLPSGAIIFRFMDEHDLNVDPLIKRVEELVPSCK